MLYFTIQNRLQAGVRSPKRRVRDDDFIVGYPRIILGLWSNRLSIGGSTSGIFRANLDLQDFVAGAVFGEVGGWLDWLRALEMTYVTQTTDEIDFVWQAQYLVRLEGHFVCQVQYLVRLAGDFSWQAQHFVTFWEIAGTRNVVFYNTKSSPSWSKVSEAAGARWRFYRRISSDILGLSSDYGRIVFLLAEALQGFSAQILTFKISWQAQYLVRLEGDLTGSAHWKWRFICDADHWWHWFCVAGAVFGEVAGWLYWLHALEMRFHMWRKSFLTFILRGRRSIWWGWRVTWLAPRIGNELSYVTQIIDDIHFAWQAQYLVRLEGDFTCSTHWKWAFICDADHWWHSFCVAGAEFGEVGRWLLLRRAVQSSTGVVLCSTEWYWSSTL